MTLSGNQLFPLDNPWNHPVADAPVAANSSTLVNSIGGTQPLHPDFGSGIFDGTNIGIPYNVVSGSQPKVNVVIDAYPDESDLLPVPIPANAVLEGDPAPASGRGDSHLIVYDQDNNIAYELFGASRPSEEPDGQWHAASEAVWDLSKDSFRTPGFTSADAAGLPILPGLTRPDEVLTQGIITHALRFTVPHSRDDYVFPASHESGVDDPTLPRMGERFRLKASFDISGFSAADQVILQALKDYGMIVADNGSSWYLGGSASDSWDNDDLHSLTHVLGNNFEAVDLTPIVSSLDQSSGSSGGGTAVTVHGLNFQGNAGMLQVYFGTVAATNVNILSDNTLIATAPAHAAGSVDVTVTTPYGTSGVTSTDRFTFATSSPISVAGTPSNDVIYVRRDGNNLDEWLNSPQPGHGAPTQQYALSGATSLSINGGGGADTIILDESGGDILAVPTTLADSGGSAALALIGTTAVDNLLFDGGAGTLSFNSRTLSFSNVNAFTYWDSTSADNIESAGSIPITIDVSDANQITNDTNNVTINLIGAGASYVPPVTPAVVSPVLPATRIVAASTGSGHAIKKSPGSVLHRSNSVQHRVLPARRVVYRPIRRASVSPPHPAAS